MQAPSQEPLHVPLQYPIHAPEQSHCASVALMIAGALVSIIAPKMGRALLAAFLKNSLRDWSSALFLLFFITLEVKNAYELPNSALIVSFWSGNKKDVGVYSSAPIPTFRPSHCLFLRISNASQPTPSDIITNLYKWYISRIETVTYCTGI